MTPEQIYFYTYLFFSILFGLCLGSFANVLMWRIPRIILEENSESQGDLVKPSCCNVCHAPIKWYHNIPVLSWVILKGKCSSCGTAISARYPLVEIAGGILAAVCYLSYGNSLEAIAYFSFFYLTLIALTIDLEHKLLPWTLSCTLGGLVVLKYWAEYSAGVELGVLWDESIKQSLLMALIVGGILEGLMRIGAMLLRKEAMGGGDPPYAAALCLWVGSVSHVADLFLIACGVSIIAAGILKTKQIPFGPGLTIAAYWIIVFPQWTLHNFLN